MNRQIAASMLLPLAALAAEEARSDALVLDAPPLPPVEMTGLPEAGMQREWMRAAFGSAKGLAARVAVLTPRADEMRIGIERLFSERFDPRAGALDGLRIFVETVGIELQGPLPNGAEATLDGAVVGLRPGSPLAALFGDIPDGASLASIDHARIRLKSPSSGPIARSVIRAEAWGVHLAPTALGQTARSADAEFPAGTSIDLGMAADLSDSAWKLGAVASWTVGDRPALAIAAEIDVASERGATELTGRIAFDHPFESDGREAGDAGQEMAARTLAGLLSERLEKFDSPTAGRIAAAAREFSESGMRSSAEFRAVFPDRLPGAAGERDFGEWNAFPETEGFRF